MRRATNHGKRGTAKSQDFYPRSPCGERPGHVLAGHQRPRISIHALLAESDAGPDRQRAGPGISIHALLAESDPRACPASSPRRYFYPRSPCGERPTAKVQSVTTSFISIHALLAESDRQRPGDQMPGAYFYPRSPCGERLDDLKVPASVSKISIHALLAESDTPRLSRVVPTPIFLSTLSLRRATRSRFGRTSTTANFYPRSPCGERRRT